MSLEARKQKWVNRKAKFSYGHIWLGDENLSFNRNYVIYDTTVPLVEQELLTLQEHLSSRPVVSWLCVAVSLVFYVVFCRSMLVLLYLTFVLSTLGFTDSAYCFGIFKLLLGSKCH